MHKRTRLAVLTAFAVVGAIAIGAVYAITIEVPARGTFVDAKDKTELLRGIARLHGEPTDATVQRIQMSPGEGPNWHTHAGPVIVLRLDSEDDATGSGAAAIGDTASEKETG